MKAMILAAGLGTRLRPLTDNRPKALIEVGGVPILERVILSLKESGFESLIVNVHHFADQIIDFLDSHDYGIKIKISDERETLLDTGGGIVKASSLMFEKDRYPVLIHNVDIMTDANLTELMDEAEKNGGGGTLLVSKRDSSRKLIFDKDNNLRGWHNLTTGQYRPEGFVPEHGDRQLAFSGIYVLTYEGVKEMERLLGKGKYSVTEYFLDSHRESPLKGLEKEGLKIMDIGKPASLERANEIYTTQR